MKASWLLLLALLFAALLSSTFLSSAAADDEAADDETVGDDDEGDMEEAEAAAEQPTYTRGHENVLIRHFFADYPDRKFPAGAIVDVAFGLQNLDKELNFNISQAFARLTSPTDFDQVYFNFTGFEYGVPLPPGGEQSIVYKFRSDPNLDPREFGLVVDVLYNIGPSVFVHTAFNGTIEFVEPERSFIDVQGMFAYLMIIAMLVGGGYFMYRALAPKGKKRSKAAAQTVETGTTSTFDESAVDKNILNQYGVKKRKSATSPSRD